MIQLARRVSPVVVSVLLASVGSASAECAWILWRSYGISTNNEVLWSQHDAFETRQKCVDYLDREQAGAHPPWRISETYLRVQPEGSKVVGEGFLLKCLPETWDPNGPKGGAR